MIRQLTIAALALTLAGAAWADVPGLINYQGTLQDDQGQLMDGTFTLEFRVWATPEDGDEDDLLWGQSYIVDVHQGQFNIILGAPGGGLPGTTYEDLGEVFSRYGQTYLGITVTTDGENQPLSPGVSEIAPRVQILPAPYAVSAGHAQRASNVSTDGGGVPAGTVLPFAGPEDSVPSGYLLCDGSPLDAEEYPALFEAIGHTYGGSGEQFNVPDMRGRFPAGAGAGQGLTERVLAERFGAEEHTLTLDQLPNHDHMFTYRVPTVVRFRSSGSSSPDTFTGQLTPHAVWENTDDVTDDFYRGIDTRNRSTEEVGGDEAFSLLPPSIALNYIIKY